MGELTEFGLLPARNRGRGPFAYPHLVASGLDATRPRPSLREAHSAQRRRADAAAHSSKLPGAR